MSVPKSSNFLEPPRSYSPDEESSDKEDSHEPLKTRQKIKPRKSRSPMREWNLVLLVKSLNF